MPDYDILAISDSHIDRLFQAEENVTHKMAFGEDSPEENRSRLLTISDGVAVISIIGSLTNIHSYWNRFYGVVAYSEITEAVAQAVDEGVGAIMFEIDSPGGRVSGMADCAAYISGLDIDTYAFTGAGMASAAYFLGCQCDSVYCDSFAEVGSVGVKISWLDYSRYLKEAKIDPVRFRSGDLKAVGDPKFKLTEKEAKHIEAQVETYAQKFFDIVSEARGMPVLVMEKLDITSGRTFIGEEAWGVNLVDGIKTFNEVLALAYNSATKELDKRNTNSVLF